jgi:uncharacterized protein (TIGR00251 family)
VPAAIRISVRVKPRSRRTRILKVDGLSIEASLAAPPVDGAANSELIELLASALQLPKSALRLVMGKSSKHKVVELSGMSAEEAARRLSAQDRER